MTGWTTTRPPHIPGTRSQERALLRAVDRMALPDSERAVLHVLIDHADGGGYCFLNIKTTIVPESGYSRPTIHRVLRELRKARLVEVIPFKRNPADPEYRSHAERGQGVSTYRLGKALRDAAGLRDHAPGQWSDQPPSPSDRLDETPRNQTPDDAVPTTPVRPPDSETPETPQTPCNPGCLTTLPTPKRETPVTVVTEELSLKGDLREAVLLETHHHASTQKPNTHHAQDRAARSAASLTSVLSDRATR